MQEIFVFLEEGLPKKDSARTILAAAAQYIAAKGLALSAPAKIGRGSSGKPFFEDAPWLHFSLSHSGALWALAIGQQVLGLDIQLHRPVDRMGIAQRFFHPAEAQYLAKHPSEEALFFQVWTAKESYVKYTGEGIAERFRHFAVTNEAGLLRKVSGANLRPLPLGDGISACLCAKTAESVCFQPKIHLQGF